MHLSDEQIEQIKYHTDEIQKIMAHMDLPPKKLSTKKRQLKQISERIVERRNKFLFKK